MYTVFLSVLLALFVGCEGTLPPLPELPTPRPTETPSPATPTAVPPTPMPTPVETPTTVPAARINQLIGYSLPNSWQLQDPGVFARLLGDNGLTATQLDWTPYIGSPDVCPQGRKAELQKSKDVNAPLAILRSSNATYPDAAKALVHELRQHRVTAVINIANMNGCATTSRPDAWFQEQLDWIVNNIGQDGVILYPVSEPWAFEAQGKSQRWTNMARGAWAGLFNIPDAGANSYTGNPYWNIGYDTLDVHYCDSNKLVSGVNRGDPKSIANTDCSPILNPGPTVAADWTKLAINRNTNLLIYDFRASSPDVATVQAMGAVITGAVPVPTATPVTPAPENINFLDDGTVGGWPETSHVTNTTISNPNVQGSDQYGEVCIYHSKAGMWPITGGPDGRVEGNPWFVAQVNGQWYASTYEWLGPGTVCRSIAFGIWGKYSQYSQVQAWHPQPGEQIGLFVSTVARPGVPHTINERSNIVWINWPSQVKAHQHKAWKRP